MRAAGSRVRPRHPCPRWARGPTPCGARSPWWPPGLRLGSSLSMARQVRITAPQVKGESGVSMPRPEPGDLPKTSIFQMLSRSPKVSDGTPLSSSRTGAAGPTSGRVGRHCSPSAPAPAAVRGTPEHAGGGRRPGASEKSRRAGPRCLEAAARGCFVAASVHTSCRFLDTPSLRRPPPRLARAAAQRPASQPPGGWSLGTSQYSMSTPQPASPRARPHARPLRARRRAGPGRSPARLRGDRSESPPARERSRARARRSGPRSGCRAGR